MSEKIVGTAGMDDLPPDTGLNPDNNTPPGNNTKQSDSITGGGATENDILPQAPHTP